MDWHNEKAKTGARALESAFGVMLTVCEATDSWWNWHAEHEGLSWTPDARWFATRREAQEAAEEWAATLAPQHLGFLHRAA